MKFREHYFENYIDYNDWNYLELYWLDTPNEVCNDMWSLGNGYWEGYITSSQDIFWDINLIFTL